MARSFRRTGRGLMARLDPMEVRLLHEVFTDLDGLLARDAEARGGQARGVQARGGQARDTDPQGAGGIGDGGDQGGPSPDPDPDQAVPQWALDLGLADVGRFDQAGADSLPAGPTDPAIARLLPAGSRDDPLMAAEFRRLTESSVRDHKRSALATTLATLASWMSEAGPQLLPPEAAQALLVALTDVRLVMAERLGIRTEADADAVHALAEAGPDPHADGPDADVVWMADFYDFLTWLQTDLAEHLIADIPRGGIGGRRPPEAH